MGLVVGRWWCVPVAAGAWGALLYADGTASGLVAVVGAGWLAAVNAFGGVGVRQLLAHPDPEPRAERAADRLRLPDTANVLSFLRLDPSA
jgi:hypothetical protein